MARKMMLIVGLVFGCAGVVLLVVAGVLTADAVSFRSNAVSAQGTITEIGEGRECDDGRCRNMYSPVIEFTTADGEQVSIAPDYRTSSEPEIGDHVTVLYPESAPEDARVDNFIGFWFPPVLCGGLGVVMAGVGIPILVSQLRRMRTDAWLATNGRRMSAQLVAVDLNRSVRIHRRHPWRVFAVGTDPTTGAELRFVSANLLDDPRPALEGVRSVDILIDPRDPGGRYRMDLSAFAIDD